MAILNRGFDQTNLNGSVGAVTYRRVDGRTIASQRVPMKSSARRTLRVMLQRMKWPNLVQLFRAMNVYGWHPSFIHDAPGVGDFQRFMQVNLPAAGIYLTKSIANYGGVIVAPVVVTEGGLTPIDYDFDQNGVPSSDLQVGTLTIGSSTTLQAFSNAIIDNNEGWLNGDQLTLIVVRQVGSLSMPIADTFATKVTLDTSDDAASILLSDVFEVSAVGIVSGKLALGGVLTNGGIAFIHSRRLADGKTSCSRQSLLVANAEFIPSFTGQAAFEKAAKSYGGIETIDYLTPDVGDVAATTIEP